MNAVNKSYKYRFHPTFLVALVLFIIAFCNKTQALTKLKEDENFAWLKMFQVHAATIT